MKCVCDVLYILWYQMSEMNAEVTVEEYMKIQIQFVE